MTVGQAIVAALQNVSATQPAMVAGYWANKDFWLRELRHLAAIIDGYEARLHNFRIAHDQYANENGGPYNYDGANSPHQEPRDTSSSGKRHRVLGNARTAVQNLAERALDLSLISIAEYDAFISEVNSIQLLPNGS